MIAAMYPPRFNPDPVTARGAVAGAAGVGSLPFESEAATGASRAAA
jgi:hypothetical protein